MSFYPILNTTTWSLYVGSIPYLRTDRSTVTKMKAAVSRSKAGLKNVVYQVEEDVGGLTKWQKSLWRFPKKSLK